jgi:DNA-binding response OmpR family regulator
MRVLVGDDKQEIRDSLARALKLRGLEVDLAQTPQEVIARARNGSYGAVVTDLQYTENGSEGYEVLRELRNLPAKKIIYTAQSGFEYAAEAFESGADYAVLRKDSSELYRILDELNLWGQNDN